ncbi:unnamed protein product [Microthlaspi erraticum]|uniref:TAFII28-like protein domain-containing protein n=1 Tax=Microthlaspi erraticum TaxID=1685480 RepID=A0A6D2HNX4_9BRAS|nr:unnamed protein product [Microthlaspi erraticum]
MKRSKDPFEDTIEEESPPESPIGVGRTEMEQSREEEGVFKKRKTSVAVVAAESSNKAEKVAKMQSILSQFTEEQTSRYESFRRSALNKTNMKKLLERLTGNKMKPDDDINTVVCGIAKMFVGELVETARVEMGKRKETGPIRPCHIRESYRRLKLQGKVPQRSVPRLFR